MNTVIETTLARLPPARLSTVSICENTCFACASKLLAMSLPALSRVAVWPATHTILPPSVITPGEKARESWNGVFSMYSAAGAASGRRTSSAAVTKLRITGLSLGLVLSGDQLLEALIRTEPDRRDHRIEDEGGERVEEGEQNRHGIDRERNPPLEVVPEPLGERRVAAVQPQQHAREDGVPHARTDQHHSVNGN